MHLVANDSLCFAYYSGCKKLLPIRIGYHIICIDLIHLVACRRCFVESVRKCFKSLVNGPYFVWNKNFIELRTTIRLHFQRKNSPIPSNFNFIGVQRQLSCFRNKFDKFLKLTVFIVVQYVYLFIFQQNLLCIVLVQMQRRISGLKS